MDAERTIIGGKRTSSRERSGRYLSSFSPLLHADTRPDIFGFVQEFNRCDYV